MATTSSSSPQRSSWTTPPRDSEWVELVSRDGWDRSTMTTSWPARASSRAVAAPAHRAPTTTTSWWLRRVRPNDCAAQTSGDGVPVDVPCHEGSLTLLFDETRLRERDADGHRSFARQGGRVPGADVGGTDGNGGRRAHPVRCTAGTRSLPSPSAPLSDARSRGSGRLVLLAGEAGIGKTRLLRAAAGARRGAGLRAVDRRGLTPGRRALRGAAPGPRACDGAVGPSRGGRPRDGRC